MAIVAYEGISTEKGKLIRKEFAYEYAMERVKNDKSLQEEFEQWFYSGDFVNLDQDEFEEAVSNYAQII